VLHVRCYPESGHSRIVGEYFSRSLGQQVIVENKSGANGNIGIEAAATSAPDGYTFLVSTDSVTSNPHVYKMNIDVLKDLVPVVQLSHQPIVLAAHPSLGVKSISELVALAKQQPGLNYATGRRASNHRSDRGPRETWISRLDTGLSPWHV
jgi:tripartite-type tricarboxylate transporter receptor subunit TctC